MLNIVKLRCLHLENPLGIDQLPYFSWILQSTDTNVMQSDYQLVVKNEAGAVYWDTGTVESDQSIYINYGGTALKKCTRYIWSVTVTDNYGNKAEASAYFETAILDKTAWRAKWVKTPFPMCERQAHLGEQPPAVLFRKQFQTTGSIKKARLYATCHGVYNLTINGQAPDDRQFAPECTVYRNYLCYQTYDVTDLLKEGANVLGMHVGDGWYHGFMTKAADETYDPAFAVLFQLSLEYENGTCETIISDNDMLVTESPVRCSDLFAGERYDANFMPYGWDTFDYDPTG